MHQSRSISLTLKDDNITKGWDLTVSGEDVGPHQVSADLIAQALIITAVENLIKQNEQALAALKGKRGKRYTQERQILNATIAELKDWQASQPTLPVSVDAWREHS